MVPFFIIIYHYLVAEYNHNTLEYVQSAPKKTRDLQEKRRWYHGTIMEEPFIYFEEAARLNAESLAAQIIDTFEGYII